MAHGPLPGRYQIITWENGNYFGASISVPPNSSLYSVRVVVLPTAVTAPPPFTVEPVDGGASIYIIMAEKRNTRGDEDGVVASQNEPAEEWVICCEGSQDQYTINQRGVETWTALLLEGPVFEHQVLLRPLVVLPFKPSEPPPFFPSQLFKFIPVDEE
ncbi:hypothetical protein EDD17DRAFT_1751825 [Pisolithus thermaeus]|nr:hypothetical protein EDD17DRAFT_1751825 [Pisolithus thermaeus]